MNQDKIYGFRKIYDERFNNLVIYSVGMGVPLENAKDLVQESFIRLWEKYDDIDAHVSYLFRAVRNSSLNFISSSEGRMRNRTVPLGELGHRIHHDDETERAVEYFHKLEEVYERIMNLTGRSREVFTMVYMHKMKIKDVASELDLSENTVKTHLKRAKEILRQELKDSRKSVRILVILTLLLESYADGFILP